MKKKIEKQPLMRLSHLPLILLGSVMTAYGLVTALVSSWFSNQAMRGLISAVTYRNRQTAFDQTAGLVAGLLLLGLFIWCAVASRGIVRVALCFGAVASISILLTGRADLLRFVPSAFAGPVITVLFALPMTILFILLACGRRVPRGCRWVAFVSIFVVLITAFLPIIVTVLALLLNQRTPAVAWMIDVSPLLIKLRYLLPGLSFLLMAFLSARFARKQPVTTG